MRFQVVFRFNFLVLLLCLTMNRPYQFYYFVPLVSFWFLVVYAVLGVWPRVDSKRAESEQKLNYIDSNIIIYLTTCLFIRYCCCSPAREPCYMYVHINHSLVCFSSAAVPCVHRLEAGSSWRRLSSALQITGTHVIFLWCG